jgi:hypothetical protein
VPFTFFAHQAPVLPLVRRRTPRWDGVALVVGSAAPDLAYVTRGWGYGPWGIPLWFDGHRPQNVAAVAAGATVLAWVIRWWVLPVLPLALPDGGRFHLRDYRFLAQERPRWWITFLSALAGVVTHLVLDAFTHSDGSAVEISGPLQISLFTVGSRTVHVYTLLQYGGSVVLGIYAFWTLRRMGSERRFVPADVDPDGAAPELPRAVLAAFWTFVLASCALAVAYAQARSGFHYALNRPFYGNKSVVIISFCWVAFVGLTFACLAAEPFVRPARSPGGRTSGTSVVA